MSKQSILLTIKRCCEVLEDKKAEKVVILDVRGKCSITDYFIIATGTAEPHLKALAKALDKELRELDIRLLGSSLDSSTGWVVLDGFDFMIHLFTEELRGFYALERLWGDAKNLDHEDIGDIGSA